MKIRRSGSRGGSILICVFLTLLCFTTLLLSGCGSGEDILLEGEMTLSLSSTAFGEGEAIPTTYSCDGDDVSPQLTWSEAPAGTQSFTLIADDPDAPLGTFTHWILFNIPANSRELPEAIPTEDQLPSQARQGKNGLGKIGYTGPCPPPGSLHHYRFNLYALDEPLTLEAGASRTQILKAMQGHVLAQGQLTGTYQR